MQRLRQVLAGALVLMCLGDGAVVAQAVDSTLPYASLLQQYHEGKTEPAFVRALARRAHAENDTVTASKISADHIARMSEVYTPEHLRFVREFTRRSTDPGFALFHRQAAKVDEVMGEPGYAEAAVDDIITGEEISPAASPSGQPSAREPAWATLTATIETKYGASYADRNVRRAKVFWYWGKEHWPEFSRELTALAKKYGIESSRVHVNNASWPIFLHSNDQAELAAAASWMARVVQQQPDGDPELDTYANLLYKLGQTAEGIAWEEKALAVATANKDSGNMKVFQETLAKMKKGEPTWPSE